jgi:hypothetical protein
MLKKRSLAIQEQVYPKFQAHGAFPEVTKARQVRENRRVMRQSSKPFAAFCIKRRRELDFGQSVHSQERNTSVKSIREILRDRNIAKLVDWDLHPFDAVGIWNGAPTGLGASIAKSCNEEYVYQR